MAVDELLHSNEDSLTGNPEARQSAPLTLFPEERGPGYTVRESQRARTVRLNMTPREGLVVVVPAGYNLKRIPGFLEEKRAWIEKARIWADGQRQIMALRPVARIPDSIELKAVGETWEVSSRNTASGRAMAREHGGRLLVLSGPLDDTGACLAALSRWVGRQARRQLVPWLDDLSRETGLEYSGASIGNQRSRWGSCSPQGKISLNLKLLFLPDRVVRYVLVHELCHLVHMNHSQRFWARVRRHEPAWRELRKELGDSWQHMPAWVENG